MGLILGALAGGGGQLADFADKQIAQDQALDRERYSSDLAQNRAIALEQAKIAIADTERQRVVDRVHGAAERIADDRLAPKVAQEQAGIVDRAAWTPEQQAAVDQSNAIDRKGLIQRAVQDGSAAVETGDIHPKDAAVLNNKSDALLYKTLYEQSKEDGRNARADARNEVTLEGQDKRLQAMLAHFSRTAQGNPVKEALSFIGEARKAVTSEASDTRALMKSELDSARNKDQIQAITQKYSERLASIDKRRRALDSDFNTLRTKVGLGPAEPDGDAPAPPAPGAAPAAPAPVAPPPSLPPGAKQIGTSKGRPVYQLPDGSKVVAQ